MLTTILVGSSGSGKSTHAKTLGQVICSTDRYVEEQACSLITKLREMAKKYGKTIIIKGVYFVTPKNVIWQRLEHRKDIENKSIPVMLVEEQIEKYQLPIIEEGFDYLIKKV